jgi:hypothetical protein
VVVEWVLSALMLAYCGLQTLPAAWKTLNTDFSNYYLTARLAREKNDTSRIYEWIWLQRQKDHRDIDQRIISLVPITPFSTLAVWPVAAMPPLAAKHRWLMVNMAMVVAIVVLLRSLTQLALRRVVLVTVLSVPLSKNFLYGQYYVLLLFVLTFACWLYLHQRRFLSGLLVGLGFGLKLFPILYLGYFLRKRDFRAFAGGVIGAVAATIASITVFGWQANRVLVNQVLPWTLRGEGMDPYNLSSASITTLLHRLFIYEPQWNPKPSIYAPWLFALLLPLAQTLLFAPAWQFGYFYFTRQLSFHYIDSPRVSYVEGGRGAGRVSCNCSALVPLRSNWISRMENHRNHVSIDTTQRASTVYRSLAMFGRILVIGRAKTRWGTPRYVVMDGSLGSANVAKYCIWARSSKRAVCGLPVAASNCGGHVAG